MKCWFGKAGGACKRLHIHKSKHQRLAEGICVLHAQNVACWRALVCGVQLVALADAAGGQRPSALEPPYILGRVVHWISVSCTPAGLKSPRLWRSLLALKWNWWHLFNCRALWVCVCMQLWALFCVVLAFLCCELCWVSAGVCDAPIVKCGAVWHLVTPL